MHRFEVSELTLEQLPVWDALVDQSQSGTIFHKTGWLDTCAQSLGKKVKIIGCFENGVLVGGCSLFLERSHGIVMSAKSTCAVTPYGGLVISLCPSKGVHKQESYSGKIIASLINAISREKFYSIHIKNSPEFRDIRPLTANGWNSTVFYTYYLNLEGDMVSRIDSAARYNYRKAQRNGITIEPLSDISQFYALYSRTFTRKNLKPPASESLVSELYLYLQTKNCGEIIVAKTPEGEIAAAEINIWDNRMAYSWLAASDSRYLDTRASTFLTLANLQKMQARGFQKMNIMMANIPELSRFAAQLNPVLVPYYQIQKKILHNIFSIKNLRLLMVIPLLVLGLALNMLEAFEIVGDTMICSLNDFQFPFRIV